MHAGHLNLHLSRRHAPAQATRYARLRTGQVRPPSCRVRLLRAVQRADRTNARLSEGSPKNARVIDSFPVSVLCCQVPRVTKLHGSGIAEELSWFLRNK